MRILATFVMTAMGVLATMAAAVMFHEQQWPLVALYGTIATLWFVTAMENRP